jgi:DNA-binding HxlR family transcriptional regulator
VSGKDRTYGQYCPIAAGLDVLGDRWVLLICRELSMGQRRFSDLRASLPGIAPNLLIERLRSLQAAGLVETVELPPPAARTVYQLTEDGLQVVPVLRSLARFGVRFLADQPSHGFGAQRAAHALLGAWRQRHDVQLRARLVVADEDEVDIVLDGYNTRVERPQGQPDVVMKTAIRELVEARRRNGVVAAQLSGSPEMQDMFLEAFGLVLQPADEDAAVRE